MLSYFTWIEVVVVLAAAGSALGAAAWAIFKLVTRAAIAYLREREKDMVEKIARLQADQKAADSALAAFKTEVAQRYSPVLGAVEELQDRVADGFNAMNGRLDRLFENLAGTPRRG